MKKTKGFTLVELIIVIVIIGILAAVTIIGYSSQAANARRNSVFAGLTEAVKAANVCLANSSTGLNAYTAFQTAATSGAGKAICASATSVTGNWPDVSSTGWAYTAGEVTTGGISSTVPIIAGGDSVTVTCATTGCTKSW